MRIMVWLIIGCRRKGGFLHFVKNSHRVLLVTLIFGGDFEHPTLQGGMRFSYPVYSLLIIRARARAREGEGAPSSYDLPLASHCVPSLCQLKLYGLRHSSGAINRSSSQSKILNLRRSQAALDSWTSQATLSMKQRSPKEGR